VSSLAFGQKPFADSEAGIRRILGAHSHRRSARNTYGVLSGINNILIVNQTVATDRIAVILVDEVTRF
jgi:hypothetical protein